MKCDIIPHIKVEGAEQASSLFKELSSKYNRATAKYIYTKIHTDSFFNWFGGDWTTDKSLEGLNEQSEPMLKDGKFTNSKGDTLEVEEVKLKTDKDKLYGDKIAEFADTLGLKTKVTLSDRINKTNREDNSTEKPAYFTFSGNVILDPDMIGETGLNEEFKLMFTKLLEGTPALNRIREYVYKNFKEDVNALDPSIPLQTRIDYVYVTNFETLSRGGLSLQTKKLYTKLGNLLGESQNTKAKELGKEFASLIMNVDLNKEASTQTSIANIRELEDLGNTKIVISSFEDLFEPSDVEQLRDIDEIDRFNALLGTPEVDFNGNPVNSMANFLSTANLSSLGKDLRENLESGNVKPENVIVISDFYSSSIIASKLGIPVNSIESVPENLLEKEQEKKDYIREQIEIQENYSHITPDTKISTTNTILYGVSKGALSEKAYREMVSKVRKSKNEIKKRIQELKSKTNTVAINEDAIKDLEDLMLSLEDKTALEQHVMLLKKANDDFEKITNYLLNDSNFETVTEDTYYNLSSIPKILEAYSVLSLREDTPNSKEVLSTLNLLIEGIKKSVVERVRDVVAIEISRTSEDPRFKGNIVDSRKAITEGKDIGYADKHLGILADSDAIELSITDVLYKNRLYSIRRNTDKQSRKIKLEEQKLKESEGENIDYSFMVEDKTSLVSQESDELLKEEERLKEKLYKESPEGLEKRELLEITTSELSQASPEDIKENIEIAEQKQEIAEFNSPEVIDFKTGEIREGDNYRYSSEFKEARDAMQYYDEANKTWVKKSSVSKEEYNKYLSTYYESSFSYLKSLRDSKGELTGANEKSNFKPVKKAFIEVQPKWYSEKYKKILSNPARNRFYKFYTAFMKEALSSLPTEVETSMTGSVPIQEKVFIEKLLDSQNKASTVLKSLREYAGFKPNLTTKKTDQNGNVIDQIPLLYVGKVKNYEKIEKLERQLVEAREIKDEDEENRISRLLDIAQSTMEREDVATNIVDALLGFSASVENFKILSTYEDTVAVFETSVEQKKVFNSDYKGTKFGQDGKKEIKKDSSTDYRLKTWKADVFYNNIQDTTRTQVAFKRLRNYSSHVNMALNPFSAFKNSVIGKVLTRVEAYGGQFFNNKEYNKANSLINKLIFSNVLSTERNDALGNSHSVITAFIKEWGLLQDQKEIDAYNSTVSKQKTSLKGIFKKVTSSTDWMFILQDRGEFDNQARLAAAMLIATKVDINGKEVSLYDAYELHEGSLRVKPEYSDSYKPTDAEISRQANRIMGVNQKIHGRYTLEEKMAIQSTSAGALAVHYKKWVYPLFLDRWGKRRYDERLMEDTEGRYLSTARLIYQLARGERSATKLSNSTKLSKLEKANLIKVLAETIVVAAAVSSYFLFSALAEGEDDDEVMGDVRKRLWNFFASQSSQLQQEVTTFIDPAQAFHLAKNPFAALRMISSLTTLVVEGVSTPFRSYEGNTLRTGAFKDDYKVVKAIYGNVPILSNVNKFKRLKEQNDYFRPN